MGVIWARRSDLGYEVSSKGDKRFSALYAVMPDGRTIEQWYQCDVKGYDVGGKDWRMGKGKPSLIAYPNDQLYEMYLGLWRLWAIHNIKLMKELDVLVAKNHHILKDMFATSDVNQARALAQILNEWIR